MKLLQINEFCLPALGAKEQEVVKNRIFTKPHTGFSAAVGAQQPGSFPVHSVHRTIRWGRDQRDLPLLAALFYRNIHVLQSNLIDFRKKIHELLIVQR